MREVAKMRLALSLAFVLLMALPGCGGGGSDDRLRDALPGLVPTLSEVQALFPERADDPAEVDAGFLSDNEPPDLVLAQLYDRVGAPNSDDNDRVSSYWTRYIIGEPITLQTVTSGVQVLVDLYKDEESAAAEVASLPSRAIRSDADPHLGDQALAWAYGLWTAPSGIEPRCPCEFRFRVGRLVGYVSVWYPMFGASYPYLTRTSTQSSIKWRRALRSA
jgi:hypothetical protein